MSSFEDGLRAEWNPSKENSAWHPKMAHNYPHLADLLRDCNIKQGDSSDHPPFSVILFSKDGNLRACITSPEHPRQYFVAISDPSDPLGSLEIAVKGNQGEWAPRRQGSSRREAF